MKTMRKVEGSSSIASYEYDDETSTLTIEFKSGTKYDYYDINSSLIDNFHTAESKGKFFAANIRDKFYVDVVEEGVKGGIANLPKPWKFPKAEDFPKAVWPFPTSEKP